MCDQLVIFDAKSPQGEDISNFPGYIDQQAIEVKKYADEEGVRKDVYLVVPSNSIENLTRLSYQMDTYQVYVIALDALEPVLMNLKRIEDYELAEQLSPEDRDLICGALGKFRHLVKRRIQIDSEFSDESCDVIKSCEKLPEDMADEVEKFEKSVIFNPSQDKRGKVISEKKIESCNNNLKDNCTHVGAKEPSTEAAPKNEGKDSKGGSEEDPSDT
jgi:hypothetical protein